MEIKKGFLYKISSIKANEVLYMNYGLMEDVVMKVVSISIDGNTIYIEIPRINRKLAFSKELINDLDLVELGPDNDNTNRE